MAARSASELSSELETAKAYGIVDPKAAFSLAGSIICTRRMITSLQKTIVGSERESEKPKKPPRAKRRQKQTRKRPPGCKD